MVSVVQMWCPSVEAGPGLSYGGLCLQTPQTSWVSKQTDWLSYLTNELRMLIYWSSWDRSESGDISRMAYTYWSAWAMTPIVWALWASPANCDHFLMRLPLWPYNARKVKAHLGLHVCCCSVYSWDERNRRGQIPLQCPLLNTLIILSGTDKVDLVMHCPLWLWCQKAACLYFEFQSVEYCRYLIPKTSFTTGLDIAVLEGS